MAKTGINFARHYDGLREVRDKEQLMQLFKDNAVKGDIAINPAETAWCAAFVTAMERMAGHKVTLANPLGARQFLKYGKVIDPKDMKEGDIAIFERGSNQIYGHVTYIDSINDDGTLTCLGGNQRDMVCRAVYSLDKLLGVRRS